MSTISGYWGKGGVYKTENDSLASLSDDEFNKKYEFKKKGDDRFSKLYGIKNESNDSSDNNNNGTGGSNSSFNSNNKSSSLFGGGSLSSDFDKIIGVSKDMAKFRQGIDQEQGRFSRGLREEEAESNFGRDTKLKDQDIKGQYNLQNLVQTSETDRTQRQLSSQEKQQKADFDQQNLFRANSAALAMRGLR